MLNLGRLEILLAVAEHGSFSAAAGALSFTQSAVSQSIARLEAETGVTLLVRGRRGVTPTAAGHTLIGHARRILAEVAAAQDALGEVSAEQRRRLRIGSFPSGGATLMPLAVARFRRVHPGVAVTLAEGEPEEIAPQLRTGELDLALLFEFPEPGERVLRGPRTAAGLRSVALLGDPLELVLPAGHRLAGGPSPRLGDLRSEPWVQTSSASPCARHVVRCCREAGFDPEVSFESDDYDTVQGLVAAGVGVALVPRLALDRGHGPDHPGIVVRSLAPAPPRRRVTVATRTSGLLSPAARAMIDELAEVARRHRESG